jgi:hypothetical protein
MNVDLNLKNKTMKGIYLTEEGKKAIEAIITNLKKPAPHYDGIYVSEKADARIELYEEILSSATILPVEDSWESVSEYMTFREQSYYPHGVIIIQPKQ